MRQFLFVKDEDGKELYFRFYDPRILRLYLPTCTKTETAAFFGPVLRFLIESEDARSLLVFQQDERGIAASAFPLAGGKRRGSVQFGVREFLGRGGIVEGIQVVPNIGHQLMKLLVGVGEGEGEELPGVYFGVGFHEVEGDAEFIGASFAQRPLADVFDGGAVVLHVIGRRVAPGEVGDRHVAQVVMEQCFRDPHPCLSHFIPSRWS